MTFILQKVSNPLIESYYELMEYTKHLLTHYRQITKLHFPPAGRGKIVNATDVIWMRS